MTIIYKVDKSTKASYDIIYVLSRIYNYYTLFPQIAPKLNIYNSINDQVTTDLYYKIIKNGNNL